MKAATRLESGGAHSPAEREVAQLLKRLPNAEPTDAETQRVWRRLEAPTLTHSWRRGLLAGSLVTAIALIAVGVRLRLTPLPPPATAQLQMTSGDVTIGDRSHGLGLAPAGHEIQAGDRLHTEAGTALLSLGPVGAVLLSSSSEMEVEQLFPGTRLNLTSGTITARVSKRPPNSPFVVQTPRFRIAVVGTVFAVATRPDGEVVVSVNEGTVEVTAPGRVQRVSAGTSWHSDSGATAPSELPLSAAALLEAATQHSGDLANLFHAVSAEPRAVLAPPAGAAPSVPVPLPAPSPVSRRPRPPPRLAVAPAAVAPTVAPAVALPPSPPAQPDPYEQAVRLMASGQNERAARLLEQGSASEAPNSGMALYELGRLRQQRLNDPVGALDAFRRYREEFPTGPLRPEVDLSMLQIALSQGNASGALQQSTEFLAANPGSERADEVRLIRGNLLREQGDCGKALEDYGRIRRAAYAEDALYFSAVCGRQLGRDESTRQALQEYLNRFPAGRYAEAARRALGGGR